MTTVEADCVVHNRKYLSKFHGAINQLRRTEEFSLSTLQQLPKHCCICNDQKGKSVFTVDDLRLVCEEIESSQKTQPESSVVFKTIPYFCVLLHYSSNLTMIQRSYKAGRFVGKKGAHLRRIERKLDINICIFGKESSKSLRQITNEFQAEYEHERRDDLWVIFTVKNNKTDTKNIEKIKRSLREEWDKIDVVIRKQRPRQGLSYGQVIPPSTYIDGDTRWKPKKRRRTKN